MKGQSAESSGSNIEGMMEHERQVLEEARPKRTASDPQLVSQRQDFCGIALSGGGLRSATFNLGLLQGLHQQGLLDMFDYLATVSGGGYIGGFWTAWRHYQCQQPPAAGPQQSPPPLFPSNERGSRGAHLSEVRHLREFSHFLNPQLGLLSLDTGRIITTAVSSVVPALLAALSFLLLALLLWQLLVQVFLGLMFPQGLASIAGRVLSHGGMALLTCGALWGGERLLLRQEGRLREARGLPPPKRDDARVREFWRAGYYIPATLLTTVLVSALWAGLVYGPLTIAGSAGTPVQLSTRVFLPALAWLGAVVVLVVLRWLLSRFVTKWMQRTNLAAVERIISRLVLLAAMWSALSSLWLAGQWLRTFFLDHPLKTGLAGAVVTLTALFARMQLFLGRRTSAPVSPKRADRLKARLPQFLAYAILGLLVLGGVLLLLETQTRWAHGWTWLAVGALFVTALTLFFFEPNLVGMHVFYRDRIARTFIGAAHGEGPGQTEPHGKDDVPLDGLKPGAGPLHLVCCAANDLASADPMANLYRGADSAVLSSVGMSVGHEWTTWERLREQGGRVPTLASAMTASGAAFNSHMGSMSMRLGPAVTFLMTTFNLRLGLWAPHPTRARTGRRQRLLVGLPFYKELLGRSRVRGPDVLLSDGGHFENLALYELVRRHCRFILVSDCGMDADGRFDDFGNAVRRVREDFGVEIRIDTTPLRARQEEGLSSQPVVVGDIEYPDGDTGVLLLIKPTLTGNEPPDIGQYRARNMAFPHESTGDQFYDEAQWEAYRRLGEHAALTAFRPLRDAMSPRAREAAKLFARARRDWLPVPTGYEQRFSRFAARAAELDALLQRQESGRLLREVFKEINELDLQARAEFQEPGQEDTREQELETTEAGAGWKEGVPRPEELAGALQILRLAMLFMEEVFLSEDLAVHYNHPAYQGLMNYFARWSYAAPFRSWWPLLKTQYSSRFTHFLETHFHLPSMERRNKEGEDIARLSQEKGFAMSCWTIQGGRLPHDEQAVEAQDPPPLERLISYQLRMPCEGTSLYFVQAAQLIARIRRRADAEPLRWNADGGEGRQVVVWQGDDLYVPAGLRGAGIREDFLRRLTSARELLEAKTFGLEPGAILVVRMLLDREALAARRHGWAETVQIYRAHGFEEPGPELKRWLSTTLEKEFEEDPALPWDKRQDEHWLPYWLVRTYLPEDAPDAPGVRSPEDSSTSEPSQEATFTHH